MATYQLPDLNGSDQNMSLPLDPGLTFPLYVVPPDTTQVQTSLTASGPATYDIEPWTGDPDVSPALSAPGVTGSQSGGSASLTYTPASGEVAPGLWQLNPSEIGPYNGTTGAPTITASASFAAVTQAFDPTVNPSTGDLWSVYAGLTSAFAPVYLAPGQSATIPLTITPSASSGTHVSGSIKLDDVFQANFLDPGNDLGGDELASIPYSYTVG